MLASEWKPFSGGSPLRTLLRDSLVASVCALLARGLGFVKEIVVAASYGLSGAVDIYLLALALIGLPANILLNAVHPPLVSAMASSDGASAQAGQLLLKTTVLTIGWLALLLSIWLLLVPWLLPLLASGFSGDKQDALLAALRWLIPWYFLNAINVLAYGLLQASRRFLQNGLVPVITPLATVAIILATGAFHDWRPLAVALVAGTALETLFLFALVYRAGILVSWRLDDLPTAASVMRNGLPLIPGMLMIGITPVLEQSIAASIGEGANAALGYGYRLPSAITSISATAIGITALPYFARLLAQQQFGYCLHSLKKLGSLILVAGLLFVVPLMFFSLDIVELLYKRAAFDDAAAARVSPVQVAYLAQIPFAILSILAIKTLSALGRNATVSSYTVATLILQAALALGLGFQLGVAGIGWAAAAGSACLATISFVTARSTLIKLST
jgi:putative peptidoglycan lipid II flippase